jgi:ribosome maturation factor RimP
MAKANVETKINDLIASDLSAMGYELVRVQVTGGGQYATLQVMAERADGKPMTVEDCVAISHAASSKLDTDDTMADRYTLEVSSPGIDRPLIRLKDFERFAGHLARIELSAPLEVLGEKQRRFQGNIVRVKGQDNDAAIEFRTDKGEISVPMIAIAKAKLVMTDQLVNQTAGKQ